MISSTQLNLISLPAIQTAAVATVTETDGDVREYKTQRQQVQSNKRERLEHVLASLPQDEMPPTKNPNTGSEYGESFRNWFLANPDCFRSLGNGNFYNSYDHQIHVYDAAGYCVAGVMRMDLQNRMSLLG